MAADKPITLKLVVDTSKNRVAFIECEKDFVDVLLSFLTLPLGTVIRLMNKKSSIGCMDILYSSVENIGSHHLISEALRVMVLRPSNASFYELKSLAVNVDDTEPLKYYICPTLKCSHETYKLVSTYPNTRCKCGQMMNMELNMVPSTNSSADGVFVKSMRFAIGDNLIILPIRDIATLVNALAIENVCVLEEKTLRIGRKEVLYLLKRSLLSKIPLTESFLLEQNQIISPELKPKAGVVEQPLDEVNEISASSKAQKITIKLAFTKERVLYAEANLDFLNLIFSFLTFPLGFLEKNPATKSCLGCLDNVYTSANYLSSIDCLKNASKFKVLHPKLPLTACKNELIKIDVDPNSSFNICYSIKPFFPSGCPYLSTNFGTICPCGEVMRVRMRLIEPNNASGGFIKGSYTYMVTDELEVTPLSIISAISLRKAGKDSPIEKQIDVGEKEALALLKSSLTSKTALTDAFLEKMSGWNQGKGGP